MRRPADDAPFGDDEIAGLFCDLGSAYSAETGEGAVVAVSGGSDSLGLLLLLRRWRTTQKQARRPTTPLVVVTVDHGLRTGSAEEAAGVAARCAAWRFEHVTLRWEGEKPATSVQELARETRYALLGAEAERRGFGSVVTAHTLDDQAETILMRLARGSALKGLAGMAHVTFRGAVALQRPLLGVTRARLRAALTQARVRWIDDPSNLDPSFLRPRLRAVLPLLAAEGLDAARFADVARKLRRADAAIEEGVRAFFGAHVAVEDRASGAKRGTRVEARWFAAHGVSGGLAGPADGATRRVAIELQPFCQEPLEIGMRILSRAIAAAVAPSGPEDAQLEALADDIDTAHRHGRPLRRTLGGALVSVGLTTICISPEPPRRAQA